MIFEIAVKYFSLCIFGLISIGGCNGIDQITLEAVITTVDSYQGLIDVAGKVDAFGTGERFEREVMMLLHRKNECEPDFKAHDLEVFGKLAPNDVALISADIEHVDQIFLDKFEVEMETFICPTAVVIKQQTLVHDPKFFWIPYDENDSKSISNLVLHTQEAHVGIINEYPVPIMVYYKWKDEQVQLNLVKPREEIWIKTFRITNLIAKTLDDKELQKMIVKSHGLFKVSNQICPFYACRIPYDLTSVVANDREMSQRKRNEEIRLNDNASQPRELPKFTEIGFSKMQVPDEVWDIIINYYHQNKANCFIEPWPEGNSYTNNLEAPSYMISLPKSGPLKPAIFNSIRPILEEWAGVELVATSCYGIRAYTNGSWLSNHVDTRATHAVSVIINVDQEVTEPWPLTIYDHAGNDYNITMAPRDMVLYESATCVHGRPSAFNGNFYANLFVHYKPVDPDKWV